MSKYVALLSLVVLLGASCVSNQVTVETNDSPRTDDTTAVETTVDAESMVKLPEVHYTNTDKDEIVLDIDQFAEPITSPLKVTGKARGSWYFEADAPMSLTDWDGRIIAEGYITAKGEWMTEEFVPFEGELVFEKPSYGDRGTLILRADNPSDLPQYDRAIEISVQF